MRIGIMSAMREEIHVIISELESTSKVVHGMRTYYTGLLYGTEVVLVFSRWGKVASATTATHLINEFNVDEIIFTGVAGSVDPGVEIGDVVIGRNLFQHDMDASPLVAPLVVPLLDKKYFIANLERNTLLQKAVIGFLSQGLSAVNNETLNSFDIDQPSCHLGDIASGDQFISTPSQIKKIRTILPKALCVEMEGASVAQVCFEYDIPFNIVRTISDKADDNSHIDFPRFASEVASLYAHGILENYFSLKAIQ